MLGDLQGSSHRFHADVCFLGRDTSKAGVALESAALPLRPSFPAHWTCEWVLPAFWSCPGVLSVNYASEMPQLDTVLGELGDLWQSCCPEQKKESVKSKAVCRGFFGNPAGQLFELVGPSCRRHQKGVRWVCPLLFKTLGEVGGVGRIWRRHIPIGDWGAYLGSSVSLREVAQTSPVDPWGTHPGIVF